MPKNKTYKREIAAYMLSFLAAFYIWAGFDPSIVDLAKYLTTPVFLFAAAAFGMDAYAKQIK